MSDIGQVRVVPGPVIPVLYPGEQASAMVAMDDVIASAITGLEPPVEEWLIEPMPGWRGWMLRWRYRLIGQWFTRREAQR